MVVSDSTKSKLLDLVADLRSGKVRLEKQMHELDEKIAAVQTTLQLLVGSDLDKSTSQLEMAMVSDSELATTRSLPEALKLMASRNEGQVRPTRAADLLIRAGRSRGKRRNLIASLYAHMKNSDDWEWESPGVFRLKSRPQ